LRRSPEKLSDITLKFQVSASSAPGTYEIGGTSNLPNKSQIRVAAIRYLRPTKQASQDLNPKLTYSILSYQTAEVRDGKWQTALSLWKPAADGRYQEAWQLEQSHLGLTFSPASDVFFMANYVMSDRTQTVLQLDQELQKQGKTLENGILLTTVDNRRYVQSGETMAIALPTGGTTPPAMPAEDINGGWGDRFLMPPEPENTIQLEFPANRRTNAPAALGEFLR
jgi:hypothetical protein